MKRTKILACDPIQNFTTLTANVEKNSIDVQWGNSAAGFAGGLDGQMANTTENKVTGRFGTS